MNGVRGDCRYGCAAGCWRSTSKDWGGGVGEHILGKTHRGSFEPVAKDGGAVQFDGLRIWTAQNKRLNGYL